MNIDCIKSILPSRMQAKTIMWWITMNILGMCWYALIANKPLDGSIAAIYGIAITGFTGKKIVDTVTDRRTKPRSAPDVEEGAI